jgi:hypothetical protein
MRDMNLFLSPQEVRDLTQRARLEGQMRMLQELGLPFRQVHRRLLVARHHVHEWLAGRPIAASHEPDMSAIL